MQKKETTFEAAEQKADSECISLFSDLHFKTAFNVTSQVSANPDPKPINYQNTAEGTPQWRMSQWGVLDGSREGYDRTLHDLQLGIETKENDYYVYRTKSGSKCFKINPNNGEAELWLNAKKEYGTLIKKENEDWPHLYIEQILKPIRLYQTERLEVDMDFEFLKNEQSDLNDPIDSTAQFSWVFQLANLNPASPQQFDYTWFNLTIYDARYEFSPGLEKQDDGKKDATGKFIYGPKGEVFLGEQRIEVGKRIHIHFDILPEFLRCFEKAQQHNYLIGTNWEDIACNLTCIGWEIPGLYDMGVKIHSFDVKAVMKQSAE